HSMGGLVARKFVVSESRAGRAIERFRLLMFGTPTTGAALADLVSKVGASEAQLSEMGVGAPFLIELNTHWEQQSIEQKLPVRYVVGGGDQIVTPSSAGYSSESQRVEVAIELDHGSIVDPDRELPFRIFLNFVRQNLLKGGSPLFSVYNIVDEPYYLNRAQIDGSIGKALASRHVWLHGESGVGKTSLLRRNALSAGWKLLHITLSTVDSNSLEAMQKGLLSRLGHAFDLDDLTTVEDLVQHCRRAAADAPTFLLVEEFPTMTSDAFLQLALWLSGIAERLDADQNVSGRVRLGFSSIATPISGASVDCQRLRDRISILSTPEWSLDALSDLCDLICKTMEISVSSEDRTLLVAMSLGRPRFVKQVLRGVHLNIGPDISMLQRIQNEGGDAE
ncbi:MAG: hypothetical protein WBA73_03610, partial [Devosia sp.]